MSTYNRLLTPTDIENIAEATQATQNPRIYGHSLNSGQLIANLKNTQVKTIYSIWLIQRVRDFWIDYVESLD